MDAQGLYVFSYSLSFHHSILVATHSAAQVAQDPRHGMQALLLHPEDRQLAAVIRHYRPGGTDGPCWRSIASLAISASIRLLSRSIRSCTAAHAHSCAH